MPSRHFRSRSLLHGAQITRVLASVLFGLQALLWGGGSIIEARAAAESLTRYSHVEDQGTTACPPIHSHLDCLVCRTMNGAGHAGSAPSLIPVTSRVAEYMASEAVTPANRGLSGPLGSRAPPNVRHTSGPVA